MFPSETPFDFEGVCHYFSILTIRSPRTADLRNSHPHVESNLQHASMTMVIALDFDLEGADFWLDFCIILPDGVVMHYNFTVSSFWNQLTGRLSFLNSVGKKKVYTCMMYGPLVLYNCLLIRGDFGNFGEIYPKPILSLD